MVSVLAARGTPKEERDVLGRWTPQGSEDYVRNYRAVIRRIYQYFIGDVRKGMVWDKLDEDSAYDELKETLKKKGCEQDRLESGVEVLRSMAQVWLASDQVVQKTEELEIQSDMVPKPVPESEDFKTVIEPEDEGDEGDYLVAVSRRGSCLHLSKGGCWRARGRRFQSWELISGAPDQWSRFCRDCWPREAHTGVGGPDDSLAQDRGRDISASGADGSSSSS